jgi:two-component sensor histidine kinase
VTSLFTPDTSFFESELDKGRYVLAWRFSIVFSVLFAALAVIFLPIDLISSLINVVVAVISVFTIFYLRQTKNYKLVFWLFLISGTLLVHVALNTTIKAIHFVDFIWLSVIIMLAYIGLNRIVGLFFLSLNAAGLIGFFLLSLDTHIEALKPTDYFEKAALVAEMMVAFFVVAYILTQHMEFINYQNKELSKTNLELKSKNKENITLLREIHHRVKNNLQIITSLLRLQKNDDSTDTHQKFDNTISRIISMSLIHDKLYKQDELSQIKIESYIQDLLEEIKTSQTIEGNIQLNIETDIEEISLKSMIPLGLIFNELITNSLKYGLKGEQNGTISVGIHPSDDNRLSISYSDSGNWKHSENNGFGLELIKTLVEQLNGTYERKNSTYTFFLEDIN